MLYQILRPFVTIAVHIFYKKIEIVNKGELNAEGPALIVSNHNNAFLDAVVVEMFAKRQIYSIARGDVFGNPFIRSILTQLRILPIFRKEEGVSLMHKNEETFEKCIELLGNREQIIMYPEGDCVTEKRLRKLRKGAARIALRAEAGSNFALNVRVLPVGLNYSAAKKFRSKLFIQIGKPILLSEYETQYQHDKVKAVNNLTLHIEKEMRTLLVGVEHHANDVAFEELLQVYKPQLMESLNLKQDNLQHDHRANRMIAAALSYFHHHHHEKLQQFKHHLHDYHQTLNRFKVPLRLFTPAAVKNTTLLTTAAKSFLIGVGMPLHIAGVMLNYLPYRFAYTTADKKVKQAHFHASVNLVIGLFGWIFYYLFQLLAIGLISKSWSVVLAFALIIPLSGLYSLKFYSFMRKTSAEWNLLSLLQNNEALSEVLMRNRTELINEIERAKETYCRTLSSSDAKNTQFSNTIESV